MPLSTITRKGQTTVPKEIRDHLGLSTGDRIEYTVDDEGRVILTPSNIDIAELDGFLARKASKRATLADMQRAIESEAARSVARKR
ncbi:MAG: type II toxin-antitoxin system PrlF family antitoxin [Rhodothermales bacterium]